MAQQQLLLIVLAVIVIGVAVIVAVSMFADGASSANRDAVMIDLQNLATRAQAYYRKPRTIGGGGKSFVGLSMAHLTTNPTNQNGTYSLGTSSAASVVLDGTGVENGPNGSPVAVSVTVYPDSITITVVN